jgi:hypothetical protein
MPNSDRRLDHRQEQILLWVVTILIALVFIAVVGLWVLGLVGYFGTLGRAILTQHFQAIVGLPAAAAASLVIVFIFSQTGRPIEFEALTIKFKGAAGPVVLWILCFLSIAAAIKILW